MSNPSPVTPPDSARPYAPSATNLLPWRGPALFWLLGVSVAARIIVWLVYEPIAYPDTGTYLRLAEQIRTWEFSAYDGTRTPGYPLLMLLADKSGWGLWLLQSVMGMATSILVFLLALQLSRRPGIALCAGLAHTLALNVLFFEAAMLTEAATGFLVTLSLWLFARLLQSERTGPPAFAMGLVAALCALTHPLFAFLGPLYAALAALLLSPGRRARASLIVLAVFAAPVGSWVLWNKHAAGFVGITSFVGYNLSNHSGRFMEDAPPSPIRDIYLEHRARKIRETGRHAMTIFLAEDEIRAATGLTRPELSRELARISLRLILDHPLEYLKGVFEQWVGFWSVPNYWRLSRVEDPQWAAALSKLWTVEQWSLRILNLVFVLAAAYVMVRISFSGAGSDASLRLAFALVAIVLSTSAVQALFEYGNTRYSIPTQPLVAAIGVVALGAIWRFVASRIRDARDHGRAANDGPPR